MNDRIAQESGSVSGVVIRGIAKIHVLAPKDIDILCGDIALRDVARELAVEVFEIRDVGQERARACQSLMSSVTGK